MITPLSNGMKLYHGSYVAVIAPDLSQCRLYKDFGRGFYLTTNRQQAVNFARLSTRKAKDNQVINQDQSCGVVSTYTFTSGSDLEIKVFAQADRDWSQCVVGHRKNGTFADAVSKVANVDVIGGKIANDNTNATINAFINGTFGDVQSVVVQDLCISLLLPERLEDQYCFRTDASLRCLQYVESERV